MQPVARHDQPSDTSFDGGDLDCGNGLLLLIRKHIDPLARGQLLEIRSTEISVDEDLPARCRLTGNQLVSWTKHGRQRSFLVCKGSLAERTAAPAARAAAPATPRAGALDVLRRLPDDARIGVGVVNQKHADTEPAAAVSAAIERAVGWFGASRVLLHPDCGFATFADNPIASATVAERKLAAIAQAVERRRT